MANLTIDSDGELDQAIKELYKVITDNLPEIRGGGELPEEAANAFPFLIIYPGTGTWQGGSSEAIGLHRVKLQYHWPRKDLPRDVQRMIPLGEKTKNILLAPHTAGNNFNLNGKINFLINEQIEYTFGSMTLGDLPTIGWDFNLGLHIQSRWDSTEGTYVKG